VSSLRKRLYSLKRYMLLNPVAGSLYELLTGLLINGLLMVSLTIIYEEVSITLPLTLPSVEPRPPLLLGSVHSNHHSGVDLAHDRAVRGL